MRFSPARAALPAAALLMLLTSGCFRTAGQVIQSTSTGEVQVAITQPPAEQPAAATVEFSDAQATLGILPADTAAPTEPAPTAVPTIQLVVVTSTPQYITPQVPMAFITPDTPAPTVPAVVEPDGVTRTPGQPNFILPDSGGILPTPTNLPGVEDECVHIIQPGDSLYLIAITYGFTVDEIVLANPDLGDSSAVLQPGDPIRLPLPECAEATEDPARTWTPAPRATATPTGTPPGTPGTRIHVVQPGDVLVNIAAQYGVTVSAIVAANQMSNPNALQVGQQLIIPPANP